jgi:hypothetical protein
MKYLLFIQFLFIQLLAVVRGGVQCQGNLKATANQKRNSVAFRAQVIEYFF